MDIVVIVVTTIVMIVVVVVVLIDLNTHIPMEERLEQQTHIDELGCDILLLYRKINQYKVAHYTVPSVSTARVVTNVAPTGATARIVLVHNKFPNRTRN